MAEKGKKHLSCRAQERLRRSLKSFDLTMLGLSIVIVISGAVCAIGDSNLGGANPAGFALWFLIVLSYLPLGTISAVKALTGLDPLMPGANEAYFLVFVDLSLCLAMWLLLRHFGKRNFKTAFLRICTRITLLVLCWGCFQLLCALAAAGWHHGGMASYHRKLYHPVEPQQVVIVADPAKRQILREK